MSPTHALVYLPKEAHPARVTENRNGARGTYEFLDREGESVPVAIWIEGEMYSRHGEALFLHFGGGRMPPPLLAGLKAVLPGVHGDTFVVDGLGKVTWLAPTGSAPANKTTR